MLLEMRLASGQPEAAVIHPEALLSGDQGAGPDADAVAAAVLDAHVGDPRAGAAQEEAVRRRTRDRAVHDHHAGVDGLAVDAVAVSRCRAVLARSRPADAEAVQVDGDRRREHGDRVVVRIRRLESAGQAIAARLADGDGKPGHVAGRDAAGERPHLVDLDHAIDGDGGRGEEHEQQQDGTG
jgi:hypothetical protein